jgi:hypothetical protein
VDSAPVKLNARLIEAFSATFLSPMYDTPVRIPALHRECWELYCSDATQASVAAPRGHAKSTALTHAYGLAVVLFRVQQYVIVVGSTEEMAIGHLGDIAKELRENDDLRAEFGIRSLITDAKTDIIALCEDGYQFRLVAKGAGQKMRGMKWNGKRPGLVLCDDLEDDEQVVNKDSRTKFARWFYRALKPVLRKGGQVRFHGTILHEDSLLAHTMKSGSWASLKFKAHRSFDDFSDILWPEQFSSERLRAIRQEFIDANDGPGYSQEYLNDPFDNSEAFLRKEDFLPMTDEDHRKSKALLVGVDFAISKKDSANRTSLTVGGRSPDRLVHVLDQYVGRWNSLEIVDQFFFIHEVHHPEYFVVESGQIWKAIEPTLYKEMQARDTYLTIFSRVPIGDKAARGRSYQRRHRARMMRFDKEASWYPGYEDENLRFTGHSEATLDDQFDSTALLSLAFDDLANSEDDDFTPEDELEVRRGDPRLSSGRNQVTGY